MLRALGIALAIVVALTSGLVVWGAGIEPRLILDEPTENAAVPGLPPEWEGREIALVADFQIGMWLDNTKMVEHVLREIVRRRPALVLIAGDFVYGPVDEDAGDAREQLRDPEFMPAWEQRIDHAVDIVRPLTQAGIPVYAVLGNHDYGMSAKSSIALTGVAGKLSQALEQAGVTVLQNTAVRLPDPSASPADNSGGGTGGASSALWLGGIGPVYPNLADSEAVLDDIPDDAPRILMMHNPEAFGSIPANAAPLALAGHTHGGQIRLPDLPFWSWLEIVRPGEVHTDGWISEDYGAPGNRLYVNRGIGFSLVPIRINCAPQLSWLRLTRSEPNG